jgi:ATP-dependent RNA helicase DDX24/MAK5
MGLEELSGAEAKALFVGGGEKKEKEEKEKKEKESGSGGEGETLEARLSRLEAENVALRAKVGEGKTSDVIDADGSESTKKKKTKKKKKKKKKKAPAASPAAPGTPLLASSSSRPRPPPPVPSDFDVSAWKGYGLCPQLLNALSEARLAAPLPVQSATLPAALVARRDVLGAAPTGSGKTLAFGLAALQGLVDRGDLSPPPLSGQEEETAEAEKEESKTPEQQMARVLILCPTRELALQVSAALKPFGRAVGARVAPLVGGISPQKQARLLAARPAVVVGTPGRLWDAMSAGIVDGSGGSGSKGKGARPGGNRSSGAAASPYLQSSSSDAASNGLRGIRYLIVDEADRMAESGRFEELSNILGRLYGSVARANLQTLVFSATLTLPQAQRGRLRAGKGGGGKGGAGLEELVEGLRLRPKPAVVDLCGSAAAKRDEGEAGEEVEEEKEEEVEEEVENKNDDEEEKNLAAKKKTMRSLPSLASGVSESYLELPDDEARDAALYSLLATTRGRALVFVNAVSAARRLVGLLKALRLPARALHAGMQQRARLKSLDAFKKGDGKEKEEGAEEEEGEEEEVSETFSTTKTTILVATDVAARGLDIPSVSLVVHYQVPPAADTYVHRCGRTARGLKAQGLALSLVTPRDAARFSALMRSLGRGGSSGGESSSPSQQQQPLPPPYPLDRQLLAASAKRVRLAARVDVATRTAAKSSADDSWRRKLAAEAEIELSDEDDEESDDGADGGEGKKRHRNGLSAVDAAAAARLDALLAQPLQPKFSSRFFAGTPAPSVPSGGGSKKRKAGESEGAAEASAAAASAVGLASTLVASRAVVNAEKKGNNKKKKKPSAAPVTVAELRAAALARALERRSSGPRGRTSSSASATVGSRRRSALVVVNPATTSLARGAGDALAVFRASQGK